MAPPNGRGRRFSRRAFVGTASLLGGGLVLWSVAGRIEPAVFRLERALEERGIGSRRLPMDVDAWLKLAPDGSITLFTGKVDFGQGIETAFGQLVAEELDVPFELVRVVMGETDVVPYDAPTFGSMSLQSTGPIVRQAAAQMRDWLLDLGAQRLGVARKRVVNATGSVFVADESEKSLTYAQLASGKPVGRRIVEWVQLKQPQQFAIIGQSVARVDLPQKVTGATRFGYDTTVSHMLHGKILRPPAVGATLQSVDFSAAQSMPGVVGIVQDGEFVGLAATRLEQAESALAAIQATWSATPSDWTHETVHELLKTTADAGKRASRGRPYDRLAGAAKRISVTVRAPYVAHLPMEPQSALAQPVGNRLEIWASTQAPFQLQEAVASALGRTRDSIVVHASTTGGAFGRKVIPEAAIEAARLAVKLGRPVRVNWTRGEEFQLDRFRPAMLVELQTGVDDLGQIAGWVCDVYAAAYCPPFGRSAMSTSADAGAHASDLYVIDDIQTTFYQSQSPLPVGIWRANGAPINALARETAIDELAEIVGTDPVSFRRRVLRDNPRLLAVMDAAVDKAGWRPGLGRTGQGIGIGLDFAQGTWVAEVARVSIDRDNRTLRVEHIDAAVDCGLVVNPAGAQAQVEGGIIGQGVSSTMKELVTFADGRVTNDSIAAYAPLRIDEAPGVDVVFVEDPSQPMQGLGEAAVCPVSAAISNAIYDLTGRRLRDLPFTPDKLVERRS